MKGVKTMNEIKGISCEAKNCIQTAVQPVTSLSATELLQVQQTQPVKLSSAAMIAAVAVNKKIKY